MKLRRRNKPENQTTAPAASTTSAGLPVLRLTITSNTSLPEPDFQAQTEKLRQVADYDSATSSWYNQTPLDRPDRSAEVLSTLFEAARVYGTRVEVQAKPVAGNDPVGSASA